MFIKAKQFFFLNFDNFLYFLLNFQEDLRPMSFRNKNITNSLFTTLILMSKQWYFGFSASDPLVIYFSKKIFFIFHILLETSSFRNVIPERLLLVIYKIHQFLAFFVYLANLWQLKIEFTWVPSHKMPLDG